LDEPIQDIGTQTEAISLPKAESKEKDTLNQENKRL
jgi:hypothetical protein